MSDGDITRKGLNLPASALDLGPAPCHHCRQFHNVGQEGCGDRHEPERQYVIGDYGAIFLNPVYAANVAAGPRWRPGN